MIKSQVRYVLYIFLVFTTGLVFAQPALIFQRAVGSPFPEYGRAHRALGQDGYVIVGEIVDTTNFDTDVFLMRLNFNSELMFQRYYGGERGERANRVIRTQDGGFAIVGATFSYGAGATDFYFIKTDPQGRLLWARTFGGEHYEECFSIYELPNGRYNLAGYNWSWGAGAKDFYLVETDSEGRLIWQRTYGGVEYEYCRKHIPTSDGGYAMVGYTTTWGNGLKDVYLVKVNSEGFFEWDAMFGTQHNDDANDLIQTNDGGYLIVGLTVSEDTNIWEGYLIKTDVDGELEWEKQYQSEGPNAFYAIKQASAGGFYLLGYTQNPRVRNTVPELIRIDQNGNILWRDYFGGNLTDECFTLDENEIGISLAGYTQSFGLGSSDAYLIQLGYDPVINCSISLRRGWNLISAYVSPPDSLMASIWSEVINRNHLFIVKDVNGRFFLPHRLENMLIVWDVRYGYYAKLTERDILEIINTPVDVETAIPLRANWNIVAYYPNQPLSPEVAFSNIEEELIIAKDESGRFYRPDFGFSNMGLLRRGKGYQIRVSRDIDLIWNVPEYAPTPDYRDESIEISSPSHFIPPEPTGINMSLLVDIKSNCIRDTCELGAFTDDGQCIGASRFVINNGWTKVGIALWGDDPTTITVEGAYEGDEISLKWWDNTKEYTLYPSKSLKFQPDEFTRLEVSFTSEGTSPNGFHFYKPVPNPFNGEVLLRFDLSRDGFVELAIFNISGAEVERLIKEELKAGSYKFIWRANDLPNGVYLAQIRCLSEIKIEKLILIK